MFILASSVCKSPQCLISTLTQGTEVVTYLGSRVQLCHRERGLLQTNLTGVCGELTFSGPPWVCPTHGMCAVPVYTAQAPGCSAGDLSKAGHGLHALPRSKLLRFRFSGTPQGHRLGWACVLCPSQVRAARATKSLGSTLPQVCGASYHLPHPSPSVSQVRSRSAISGASCVSSGELISGCDPPGGCQLSRIPGRLG